ncbi:uncharacterized protein [Nicotiana sylvestris]|uniref:uncharacterized protein n=1 Tax=Nicotiana sylvestris TaxID=4096 RepID=UPI00388CC6B8
MAIDNGNPSATKFTSEEPPVPTADMPDNEKFMIVKAWKQANFLCKGYILSTLEDDLYNVYSAMNTSKELWDALEMKYKTEDACLKKFVVAKFLDYKMIDIKTVVTQVQELQLIFHDLIAEGMVVNEAFQVAAMIEKLPPLWRDFKNYLKHKRKEMKLEDLVICLKIEEDNKTAEKKSRENSTIMGANIVEETAPKIENLKEWWIGSRATRHVCAVKEAFATYSIVGPKEEISIGNNATTKIEGYRKIFLKMTSGKVLTLNSVLHVPTIRKKLVSTSLLVKNGFKCVFVSDKVFSTPSQGGKKYFITFIDDCTRYCYVYLLNSKDEAIEAFKQYKNEVENQLNKKIKMIRSDRGGEYESLPLGSKWIFKRKIKADDTIDKYKTKLVVKGYRQKEGLDYFDTYSPVTRITSIRVLVALAAVYGLEIHQMDVKTTFLNGELEEEIYIKQSEVLWFLVKK